VTYADDLVICCRWGSADEALSQMRELMGKLTFEVNEEKTRVCRMPEETFDFLGYSFGRLYSPFDMLFGVTSKTTFHRLRRDRQRLVQSRAMLHIPVFPREMRRSDQLLWAGSEV